MHVSHAEIPQFHKKILAWYAVHKRDLPWRKTRDPYAIFVSEIMLQQTQVGRVITKYNDWMNTFPTVQTLAAASLTDVLKLWSGLGYNRRAINLKKAAESIMANHKGSFPQSLDALLDLPGIGKYTAHAILCFAFNQQVPVVDTNVRKVILVEFLRKQKNIIGTLSLNDSSTQTSTLSDKELWLIAQELLPQDNAYNWNQALMDYSSAVLKKEKISIPKQSRFKGSRRYYRGLLLKLLIKHTELSVDSVGKLLKESYTEEEQPWVKSLLVDLQKEKFIVLEKEKIYLAK